MRTSPTFMVFLGAVFTLGIAVLAAEEPHEACNAPIVSLSPEARTVFDAGRELWRYYHIRPGTLADASYWDIRAHFQGFKPSGDMKPDADDAGYNERIATLRDAIKAIAAKIAPKVYAHGFLSG